MATMKRKKMQRKVNAIVRGIVKGAQRDEFLSKYIDLEIRQIHCSYFPYEDRSGADMNFVFRMIDKKHGDSDLAFADYLDFEMWHGWRFWQQVNTFVLSLREKYRW